MAPNIIKLGNNLKRAMEIYFSFFISSKTYRQEKISLLLRKQYIPLHGWDT